MAAAYINLLEPRKVGAILFVAPFVLASILAYAEPGQYDVRMKVEKERQDAIESKVTPKNAPIIAKVHPVQEAQIEAEDRGKDREEKPDADKDTAKLTGQLAQFTWYLVLIGCGQLIIFILQLMVFGLQAKRLRQTVDSVGRIERPYLFVEKVRVRRRAPLNVPNSWFISFQWRNVGRMPALVKECIIKFEDRDILPDVPDYTKASPLRCKQTVASNMTFMTGEIGPSPERGIKNGKPIRFIAFGRITYAELTGKVHKTGFAVEVSAHLPASSTFDNAAYEYHD